MLVDTFKIEPQSSTIYSYRKVHQSKVHEDNDACFKFGSFPQISPRTKHIAIPYHFFINKAISLEIKVQGINIDNQLEGQSTNSLPHTFEHDRLNLMGWWLLGGESRAMIQPQSRVGSRIKKFYYPIISVVKNT